MSDKKTLRAEKARVKYDENKDTEQRRKFIYRIRKGGKPTIASMKKYGITLEAINEIRKEAGREPIANDEVKGQLKEKMNLMVKDMDEVVKSVIPNVHVFERKVKEVKEVERKYIGNDEKITLSVYLECISHKIDTKSVKLYDRMLRRLLKELGYKKDDSIVPYIKDIDKVEKAIETMVILTGKNKGEKYSLGSKKLFYQAISTGLHKGACPPFEYQMGQRAKEYYNTKTDITNQQDKENRRDRTQNADYADWEEMLEVAQDYIDDEDNTLENRTFVQVYTGLGGVPRTGTFLKLHVVKKESEANDNNKNYYVKDTKTIISNDHKTGVNNNKQGEPIIVSLKEYPEIARNMDALAKNQTIIFNKRQEHTSPFFKQVFGVTNTELRHSQETWVHNQQDDLEAIRRASYINAHSISTARDFYTSKVKQLEERNVAEKKPETKTKAKVPMTFSQPELLASESKRMQAHSRMRSTAKVVVKEEPKKEVKKPVKAPMKAKVVVKEPESRRSTRNRN